MQVFMRSTYIVSLGTVSEIQRRQQTADDAGNQTETDAHVFSNQLVAQENTKIPEVYLGSRGLGEWSWNWSWKLPAVEDNFW